MVIPGCRVSEEKRFGGLKENELKHSFNSHVSVYTHAPDADRAESDQLRDDLERARGDDPDAMAGRMAPGGTVLAAKIQAGDTSKDRKRKDKHDGFVRHILLNDIIRAIHQRMAELDIIIENLRLDIERNLERIAELDDSIERRTKTIEQISEYLRTGKVERLPDGSLADPTMNALLLSYLRKNNLLADDLKTYSADDIRMFLDGEAAGQRAAQEYERIEQRRLSRETDEKTAAMNEAVRERDQLQEIIDEYERIQAQAPGLQRDQALDGLLGTLNVDQLRKLQWSQDFNETGVDVLKVKNNEDLARGLSDSEQKTVPAYMKDLGM